MKFPSKVTPYKESTIAKFPVVLSIIESNYNGPLVKTTSRKKFVNHSTLVVCGDFAAGGRA